MKLLILEDKAKAISLAFVLLLIGACFTGCIKYKPQPISAPAMERQYRARSIDGDAIRKFVQSEGWKEWPPAILDLNALTLIATYYSPDLDVARSQVEIADAGVKTAGARINPSLGAGGGYNRDPTTHKLYNGSLGFTIETAGKRGYRILQAEKDADAARLSLAETQWLLWSKVRSALVDYVLAERKLVLLRKERDLRGEVSEMLDKRVSVGAASEPEADVYRVELVRTEAALEAAQGDAAQKRAALATTMGIPSEALANLDIQYRPLDEPPAELSVSLHHVQKAGLLHRLDVQRALVEFAAADAALRLEIARQYPDIQLTPGYDFEEAFARYTFNSIVSALPVFNRNQGPIHAAEARRQQMEDQVRALQSQAIGEMERSLALYRSALHSWQTESDRVAKIEREKEQAARAALQAGQGDRLSLRLAELEANTAALGQLSALTQVQTSLGALENSVQQPLEPGMHVPQAPEANPRREVTH